MKLITENALFQLMPLVIYVCIHKQDENLELSKSPSSKQKSSLKNKPHSLYFTT